MDETNSESNYYDGNFGKSGRALIIGGEAFYLTFVYLWKCSFWLICRPWYLCAYFGVHRYHTRIPYIPMKHTHIAHVGKKLWKGCNRANIKKCAKVCLLTPYFSVRIVLLYPKWMNGLVRKQAGYWRYLVAKNISQCLGSMKFFKYQYPKERKSRSTSSWWFFSWHKYSNTCDEDADTVDDKINLHSIDLHNSEEFKILAKHNKKFSLYSKLPLRTISRLWGQFVHLPFPDWFRVAGFKFYIWLYSCDFHEAQQQDLKQYKTLGEFFRRNLRPELRPIHGTFPLVSPCDGTILHFGQIENGLLEQVKGVTYSLRSFLGPLTAQTNVFRDSSHVNCFDHILSGTNHKYIPRSQSNCTFNEFVKENKHINEVYEEKLTLNPRNKLYYCVIYLAPGDYHRFHSPADWTVYGRRHFTGNLFSVKPSIASWLQGLFCVNERVLYTGRWKYGFFSFTPVGALNVGSINVFFDKNLKTNVKGANTMGVYQDSTFISKKNKGVTLKKGELIGDFNLGSTIVMLFEAPAGFKMHTKQGQKVKFGQGLGVKEK